MTAVEPRYVMLADCEAVIERTKGAFVECGTALALIRDDRLYRDSFTTFEDYCLDRWQMSRPHAYRLIEASEVAAAVSPIGDIANEGQARELTGLPAETQREVFAAAHEATAGKPTAAAIREAREVIAPRPVKVTTTETTIVDSDTGEVLTAEDWRSANDLPTNPLANARAEVARQPAIVAGKGIDRLELARKTFEAAGTVAEIVADMVNDGVDRSGDWLYELDLCAALINDLSSALRRNRLRSAK